MCLTMEYPSWKFTCSEEKEVIPLLAGDYVFPGIMPILIVKAERPGAKLLATGYTVDEVEQNIRTLLQGRPR